MKIIFVLTEPYLRIHLTSFIQNMYLIVETFLSVAKWEMSLETILTTVDQSGSVIYLKSVETLALKNNHDTILIFTNNLKI